MKRYEPICWKCSHSIMEDAELKGKDLLRNDTSIIPVNDKVVGKEMVGCKAQEHIKCYGHAQLLCPIIEEMKDATRTIT